MASRITLYELIYFELDLAWGYMAKHLPLHKFLMYWSPASCPLFGLLGQGRKKRGHHDVSCTSVLQT